MLAKHEHKAGASNLDKGKWLKEGCLVSPGGWKCEENIHCTKKSMLVLGDENMWQIIKKNLV